MQSDVSRLAPIYVWTPLRIPAHRRGQRHGLMAAWRQRQRGIEDAQPSIWMSYDVRILCMFAVVDFESHVVIHPSEPHPWPLLAS